MIDLKIVDDIIIAHFPKGIKLDLKKAKQIVEERKKLQSGKSNPLLVRFDSIVSNSSDMRKFMAVEGVMGISCAAFIVQNRFTEIFLRLYLNSNKPNIPSKIFFNENEAIKWLKCEHLKLI